MHPTNDGLPTNLFDADNYLVFGVVNMFRYTNHEGQTGLRYFVPLCLRFGTSPYHRVDQWLLEVYDVDKQARRTYAFRDIQPR